MFRFLSLVLVIALISVTIITALVIPPVSSASDWWDSNWSHRVSAVITETSGTTLTDYQVKIVVPYASEMQTDFDDVRFVDNNDTDTLSYWRESYTPGYTATFWVKVPSIPASGTQTIWMYYGNTAVATASNIHNTFIWGDDFEDSAWTENTIREVEYDNCSQGLYNGEYHFQGEAASEPIAEICTPGLAELKQFPGNYVVESDVKGLMKTGGAYFTPRYSNVEEKYEFVLDFQWNQAVLNKVVGDTWANIGSSWLGYEVQANTWYELKAVVLREEASYSLWERLIGFWRPERPSNSLQVFVNNENYVNGTDSDLSYDGLAFLAYDWNDEFNIAFDNFRVRQHASAEPTVSIGDTTGLTVTINQAAGQADPTNTSPINFTVVFSEPVSDFDTGDVTLSGTAGAGTATVTGSGTTYNIAVSDMTSNGTVIASIAAGVAHNAAGNGNTASASDDNTVTYNGDTTGLTVTINQAAGQVDPTNTSPINFTVVFSESVSDFDTGDVTLSGTAGAGTATVTGSGTTYNVAVSDMTSNGTVIASIPASVAHNAAGNGNTASSSDDNTVTYNVDTNTYTITASADTGGSISPSGNVTVNYGGSQNFNINPDTGYNILDVMVDGESVGAVSSYLFANVTADHTISATFATSSPPLTVTSISPSIGLRILRSASVIISGTGFVPGATVRLEKYGKVINASSVTVLSDNQITSTFSLRGASLGKYDVVVKNPDGQEGRLPQAFTVRLFSWWW